MQYVIQIQFENNGPPGGIGFLVRSYPVTEQHPIVEPPPAHRVQAILTNTTSYNEIVAAYNEYGWPDVKFSYDAEAETISSTGQVVETWPIN